MPTENLVLVVREKWVDNRDLRLHVLDSNEHIENGRTPLLYIPGAMGSAELYLTEMASLPERRCVALSLRGHGKSDAPESGYSFDHFVSDIEAVVKSLELSSFCLYGFSLGAALALGYAIKHPKMLSGLVIGDYPAEYPAFSPGWIKRVLASTPTAKPHMVKAMQRESREVELWDRLGCVNCPTLIMQGGKPGRILTPEKAEMYLERLPKAEVVLFEDSAHELWKPDYERYIAVIRSFVVKLDMSQRARS